MESGERVNNTCIAQFLARLDQLRPMQAYVEGFCAGASMPRADCLRLNLVLEELFTNTVKHGHRGDCDAPVWVALSRTGDTVQIVYEDKAPPFNPYAHMRDDSPDVTLRLRKIGGLGVLLTKELAATRDYTYLFGRNRIRLTLAQA